MGRHVARAVEKMIRRIGSRPVAVRTSRGDLDPVTSTRTAVELQVETIAALLRDTQRSAKGDPLSTEEVYYLVPAPPFRGQFVPADADLVIEGLTESRILSVRTHQVGGCVAAYKLYVSGVAA